MLSASVPQIESVHCALKASARIVRRDGSRWELAPLADSVARFDARIQSDWLSLAIELREAPADPWSPLLRNGSLGAAVRFSRSSEDGLWHLRADLFLEEDRDPSVGLREAVDSLRAAIAGKDHSRPADEIPAADLPDLCSEAGWSGALRTSGAVAVPLEDREGLQALVEQDSSRGVVANLSLAKLKGISAASQAALGLFLCEAADQFRLLRPMTSVSEARTELAFEAVLGPAPSSGMLNAALSALQVAGRRCAREVRALGDDQIAKEYLSVRGWSPPGV